MEVIYTYYLRKMVQNIYVSFLFRPFLMFQNLAVIQNGIFFGGHNIIKMSWVSMARMHFSF